VFARWASPITGCGNESSASITEPSLGTDTVPEEALSPSEVMSTVAVLWLTLWDWAHDLVRDALSVCERPRVSARLLVVAELFVVELPCDQVRPVAWLWLSVALSCPSQTR
jgi:hypothetical protein